MESGREVENVHAAFSRVHFQQDQGSGGGTIFKLGGMMIIHGEVRSKLSEF